MQNNSTSRIIYLDLLRIFSVFTMMMLHISASQWYDSPVMEFNWQVFNIYDSLVRFCVPVFVMISGVFLLDQNKNITIKKLFSKNILRIVTAFVFWSFLYSVYSVVKELYKAREFNVSLIKQMLINFVMGHYHMWFLFTIVGLYIIVPFLRKIVADKHLIIYFITLSFVFVNCINLLKMIPIFEEFWGVLIQKSNLFFILGYSGYFLIGYYLHNYSISKKIKILIHLLGFISIIFTITATSIVSVRNNTPTGIFYGYLLPNTFFTAISIFLFFKDVISKIRFKNTTINFINRLSSFSFGMYLVHDFVNIILKIIGLTTTTYNAIIAVPINSIIVFISSYVIIFIINRIPVLNKYIM